VLKSRLFHWLLIFTAFFMLVFCLQYLVYIFMHVRTAEEQARVHLVVKEKDAQGFASWLQSRGHSWQFHTVSTWGALYASQWQDALRGDVHPSDLFQDRAEGVWVGEVDTNLKNFLFNGRPELSLDVLADHANVLAVFGYPRWAQELRVWFWSWLIILSLLVVVAVMILLSSVMADVSLGMHQSRQEIEVKHWLGATQSQLRRPVIQALLSRTLVIILLCMAVDVLGYFLMARSRLISLDVEWMRWYGTVSAMAVMFGLCTVWISSRLSFRRLMTQWVP
jgi:hypothetical protein